MEIRSLIFNNQSWMLEKFASLGINMSSPDQRSMAKLLSEILNGFADIIEMAGYERAQIDSCMNPEKSPEIREFILNQVTLANKSSFAVKEVPTVLLNGYKYSGLNTLSFWREKIEAELSEAG